ncbi:MAG: sulfotransferase domain-containing protein [Acidimicrobiia bacterium]
MADEGSAPHFLVIGAMRSGTTTLWSWLRSQPELFLPRRKELNFFSYDHIYQRGVPWYHEWFQAATRGQLTGEVSPSYSNPRFSPHSARRIVELNKDTKLIYLLRDPVERARSHFRLRVQTGQERRPLLEALSEPGNAYLARSRYWAGLAPYAELFPRHQVLVVRLDDLTDETRSGWLRVLDHLQLDHRPPPDAVKNVTANKRQLRTATTWARSRKLLKGYKRYPMPLRRIARKVLTKRTTAYEQQLEDSKAALPPNLIEPLWEDLGLLEGWLGQTLWNHSRP